MNYYLFVKNNEFIMLFVNPFLVLFELFVETCKCDLSHRHMHTWFCRQKRQMKREKSAADIERLKPMNGSIDSYSMNMSATNDDVNLQWHQQQRQQLVM